MVDLTIIDLPGITHVATGAQPEDIAVRGLVPACQRKKRGGGVICGTGLTVGLCDVIIRWPVNFLHFFFFKPVSGRQEQIKEMISEYIEPAEAVILCACPATQDITNNIVIKVCFPSSLSPTL